MRENDRSAFALVDIGHSPALDFQELLGSERLCASGHAFLLWSIWSFFQCTVILFQDMETQIGHGQRSAALLMLIVMLGHYPRSIPFPECAPTHSARPTGHPDQVECPLRMRLACSVSRHRDLSNRHLQTADFGHYVKRNQEVAEKRAHSCLSANLFFVGFAAYLDIIGVKGVEDPKMLFEAFADVGLDDSRV